MPPRTAPTRGNPSHRARGGGGRGDGDTARGGGGRTGRGGGRGDRGGSRGGTPAATTPHQPGPAGTAHVVPPTITTGQTSIAGHVRSVIVKRPGYGTLGRALTVDVNAYEVTVPDRIIRHYDVSISPESESFKFNMKVIKHLQEVVDPNTFTPLAVYDGRKNMFSARDLPLGPTSSASYSFTLGQPNPNARRPPKVYDVKIKKVAALNPQLLHEFIAGKQGVDNAILTTITALNIAIRMDVIDKYTTNSKSFFVPAGKKDIGGGVELWRGYFQSVRPGANKMLINVDVTTAMMYKSGPLLALCLSFFEAKEPRMLAPKFGFTPRKITALAKFLSNLSIRATHNNRNRTIKNVSRAGARDLFFDFDDRRITVAEYFRLEANITLQYPDLVCIEVESGALIPLELCVVPEGKIMKKELFQDKTREMVDFSRMRPSERFSGIRKGLDLLSFDRSPIVQHFGIELVSSDPLSIPSRVLPTPPLHYQGRKSVQPSNGSWNLVDKKFYRPATIRKWAVIIYESQQRFNQAAADRAIKDLVQAARERGMTVMMERPVVKWYDGQGNISQQFMQAGLECVAQPPEATKEGPGLFIVIIPNVAGDIYTGIKHFGDVLKGVPTQCMQAFKCLKANNQYWNNVLLKINPKLGGINNILDPDSRGSDFLKEPTIVIGADINHPAPHTTGIPSYASVVGSVDSNVVKYVATTRAQEGRREDMADLKSMCVEVFNKYKGYQVAVEKKQAVQATPKRLLFFRDGVSEGEFEIVKEQELRAIQDACREAKLTPKITLIVVGKRHHYRFCPQNPNDKNQADPKSGNCPAGMVVDQVITHPIDHDYYLLSHGGLIGTSRPAHYSVIHDENKFSADSLQSLSFSLCHIFARATRSVSIPAPVYYAHIVSRRAKNHYDPRATSDTASSTAGSQELRDRFRPLHNNQAGNMYFMVSFHFLFEIYRPG